jgi:hypothetical protein
MAAPAARKNVENRNSRRANYGKEEVLSIGLRSPLRYAIDLGTRV